MRLIKTLCILTAAWFTLIIAPAVAVSILKTNERCMGWENCKEVYCPKGYAVYIPSEGKYLPCKDFIEYTTVDSDYIANRLLR